MIRVVEGHRRVQHASMVDEMYRIRAAVFNDRLGWDVTVTNGREIDRFDDENPLYLISLDENTGRVQGSLRLLPTTGPNMLRDVFPVLLPPDQVVESPLIWESSRFSINPDIPHRVAGGAPNGLLNQVTIELLCGIVEICQLAGIRFVVSVYDARMARIFKAADCPAEVIGTPTRIGKVMTYAGLFEISDDMRRRLGRAGDLSSPVLESARQCEPEAA
ncbi:acyl-homoserine-lactone synthase [Neorhizobium sp. DT-125]|uniref:acyl-homoserine-lactone synthase n=1 Tax=Neorhizobium sp. DT-125 TaxID=3396163 RepID=UPI003F1A9965